MAVTVIAAFWGVVPPQMQKCMAFVKFLNAVGIFMATSVCLPWWMLPYDYESGASNGVQFWSMTFFDCRCKMTCKHGTQAKEIV